MDKNSIKKYAVWARNELIARVAQKANQYGITEAEIISASADSIHGKLLTPTEKKQRTALIEKIKNKGKNGFQLVVEEVAYTWFNRFTAIRFMEVNGYLPSHVRVFTDDENHFAPQILAEAIHLDMPGLDMEKVFEFKQANKTEELYKYLIITQCNALNEILPGMFQRIEDYTELLLPDNLLREGSVIEQMITLIPEEDWTDQVQIIGWLYQFYNIEPKAAVFAKNGKISKEEIPAATQLFTPDWIVRYMVENSLGRLWMEGHPNDELKGSWRYYIDEAEQEDDVWSQLATIHNEYSKIKPEEIKVIDPCMGSGHILCYMFDVLVQIYEAYGYTARDAVSSIVENNIYGLDIDDRASQLAYFAIMMQARQYDRRFFTRGIKPNVYSIVESNDIGYDIIDYFVNGNATLKSELEIVLKVMRDAKEYGSILDIEGVDFEKLYARFDEIYEDVSLFRQSALDYLLPIIKVADILSQKYDCVITNPPYMGSGGMNSKLADFTKKYYPNEKSDLFACFINKGNRMVKRHRFNCMVTMQSWMSLSSYESMRKGILQSKTITTLMHMENMVMGIAFGTTVTVFRNNYMPNYNATYHHVKARDIVDDIPLTFPVQGNRYVQIATNKFYKIPGNPIAYWVSDQLLQAFEEGKILGEFALARNGMKTGDNGRFLRLWWEISHPKLCLTARSYSEAERSNAKWFPYNKGGEYIKWYGNNEYVVNWENCGNEIFNHAKQDGRNVQDYPKELKFAPSLSWSLITSGTPAFRYKENNLSDIAGMSVFTNRENVLRYLALLNSPIALETLKLITPTINYQAGDIARIPVLHEVNTNHEIVELAERNIQLVKDEWDSREISWDYIRHPIVPSAYQRHEQEMSQFSSTRMQKFGLISWHYENWAAKCNHSFTELKDNEERINEILIDIYSLRDELSACVDEKYISIRKADLARDIRSFVSYAVGCMFGRFSLDVDGIAYAGGEWDESKYRTFRADKDNVLPICDDEYFEDDIVGKFVKFVEAVYGSETLEANLKFIADALGGSGSPRDVIRSYFLNDFYADHLKIYQKRPIYWQFDSGKKNGFKCLIYMHRYQPDTIARIRTDYVHEQQARYRTAIADLEQRIQVATTSERVKLTKLLQKLKDQETEIRLFEEKIHHLADQMIRIDLDDGVKHNYEIFGDVLTKLK